MPSHMAVCPKPDDHSQASLFPTSMAPEGVPAASLSLSPRFPNPIVSGIQVCEQQHCAPDPGIPKEVCHSWFWGVHGPCGSYLWGCQSAHWRQSEGRGTKGGEGALGQVPPFFLEISWGWHFSEGEMRGIAPWVPVHMIPRAGEGTLGFDGDNWHSL